MNQSQRARPARFKRDFDLVWIDCFAPLRFDHHRTAAGAFDDVAHPRSKNSVDTHDDFITRFDHVDERRFHAGTAGGRDRNRHPVLSFKDVAQQRLHVVHATQKERIEMSEHWRGHGREDAVIDRARPRAEQ